MVIPLAPAMIPLHPLLAEPPPEIVKGIGPLRTALRVLTVAQMFVAIGWLLSATPALAVPCAVFAAFGFLTTTRMMPVNYLLFGTVAFTFAATSAARFSARLEQAEFGHAKSQRVLELARHLDGIVNGKAGQAVVTILPVVNPGRDNGGVLYWDYERPGTWGAWSAPSAPALDNAPPDSAGTRVDDALLSSLGQVAPFSHTLGGGLLAANARSNARHLRVHGEERTRWGEPAAGDTPSAAAAALWEKPSAEPSSEGSSWEALSSTPFLPWEARPTAGPEAAADPGTLSGPGTTPIGTAGTAAVVDPEGRSAVSSNRRWLQDARNGLVERSFSPANADASWVLLGRGGRLLMLHRAPTWTQQDLATFVHLAPSPWRSSLEKACVLTTAVVSGTSAFLSAVCYLLIRKAVSDSIARTLGVHSDDGVIEPDPAWTGASSPAPSPYRPFTGTPMTLEQIATENEPLLQQTSGAFDAPAASPAALAVPPPAPPAAPSGHQ